MDAIFSTATTLNGFLADEHNSLDWLFEVDASELPEHADFLATIGALAMGATTYEWLLDNQQLIENPEIWTHYYGDMPVFVFTHRVLPVPAGANIRFVEGDPAGHVEAFEAAVAGKRLWVMGGGDLVGQFADAGLITEFKLSIAPVTLAAGAPLLPRSIGADRLTLTDVQRYGQFVELTYRLAR